MLPLPVTRNSLWVCLEQHLLFELSPITRPRAVFGVFRDLQALCTLLSGVARPTPNPQKHTVHWGLGNRAQETVATLKVSLTAKGRAARNGERASYAECSFCTTVLRLFDRQHWK